MNISNMTDEQKRVTPIPLQMKTAEEWMKEWAIDANQTFANDIRAIQLDAFKAGMTRAAEDLTHQTNHHAHRVLSDAQNCILGDRDSLTQLP